MDFREDFKTWGRKPCKEAKLCACCEPICKGIFKKVFEMEDSGLTLFTYGVSDKQEEATETSPQSRSFVLYNPRNIVVQRSSYMKDLDTCISNCVWCKIIIKTLQAYLTALGQVAENEVIGICKHCTLEGSVEKCKRCTYIKNKFLFLEHKHVEERRRIEDKKKYLKNIFHKQIKSFIDITKMETSSDFNNSDLISDESDKDEYAMLTKSELDKLLGTEYLSNLPAQILTSLPNFNKQALHNVVGLPTTQNITSRALLTIGQLSIDKLENIFGSDVSAEVINKILSTYGKFTIDKLEKILGSNLTDDILDPLVKKYSKLAINENNDRIFGNQVSKLDLEEILAEGKEHPLSKSLIEKILGSGAKDFLNKTLSNFGIQNVKKVFKILEPNTGKKVINKILANFGNLTEQKLSTILDPGLCIKAENFALREFGNKIKTGNLVTHLSPQLFDELNDKVSLSLRRNIKSLEQLEAFVGSNISNEIINKILTFLSSNVTEDELFKIFIPMFSEEEAKNNAKLLMGKYANIGKLKNLMGREYTKKIINTILKNIRQFVKSAHGEPDIKEKGTQKISEYVLPEKKREISKSQIRPKEHFTTPKSFIDEKIPEKKGDFMTKDIFDIDASFGTLSEVYKKEKIVGKPNISEKKIYSEIIKRPKKPKSVLSPKSDRLSEYPMKQGEVNKRKLGRKDMPTELHKDKDTADGKGEGNRRSPVQGETDQRSAVKREKDRRSPDRSEKNRRSPERSEKDQRPDSAKSRKASILEIGLKVGSGTYETKGKKPIGSNEKKGVQLLLKELGSKQRLEKTKKHLEAAIETQKRKLNEQAKKILNREKDLNIGQGKGRILPYIKKGYSLIDIKSDIDMDHDHDAYVHSPVNERVKGTKIVSNTITDLNLPDDAEKPLFFEKVFIETSSMPSITSPTTTSPRISASEPQQQRRRTKSLTSKESQMLLKRLSSGSTAPKGVIRYQLSNPECIEKGWTQLPSLQVLRKYNIFRCTPGKPYLNWFAQHMGNQTETLFYDCGSKLAEVDPDGHGRWYYRNGILALDYYKSQEPLVEGRYVIYNSGEEDENGKPTMITVLAVFDTLGHATVLDYQGNERLKYNQSEGLIIDEAIGVPGMWLWNDLNIDTSTTKVLLETYENVPMLRNMSVDQRKKPPAINYDNLDGHDHDSDMLILLSNDQIGLSELEMRKIELKNISKNKNKSYTSYKPFQIKPKIFKINKYFSIHIVEQSNIKLIFRDGTTVLKHNVGVVLDVTSVINIENTDLHHVWSPLDRLFVNKSASLQSICKAIDHTRTKYKSMYCGL